MSEYVAWVAIRRWETEPTIIVPGNSENPRWAIICLSNELGNVKLAREHCDRIAEDTRGQSIEGNAMGYDLSRFLESRQGAYDVPQTSFEDGVYNVGRDIVPGTYVSSGTGAFCQWELWNGPIGVPSAVVDDDGSTRKEFFLAKWRLT